MKCVEESMKLTMNKENTEMLFAASDTDRLNHNPKEERTFLIRVSQIHI